MKLATINNLKEVMEIFKQHKEYFPHIRQDYVTRKIVANNTVFQDNVVITFSLYKKDVKLGNLSVPKGQTMLHQIAAGTQGNGSASKVLKEFLEYAGTNVWLSVRENNERARAFYLKHNFQEMGKISWLNGTLPGVIYRWERNPFTSVMTT
jgi:RimJ/RimL family protein N-acetyltransferase